MRFGESTKHSPIAGGEDSLQTPLPPFQEPHYTVAEIADQWKLSRDTVRKIFAKEAGVLVVGEGYQTLRIPESVKARVHRRLCNPDLTPGRKRAYPALKSGPSVVQSN